MSFYLINSENDSVTVNGNVYTLRHGNYDAFSFIEMFNLLESGVLLSVDISQLRFTLTGTNLFSFSTNAGRILGVESNKIYTSVENTFTCPFVCDLAGMRKILITSGVLGSGVFGDKGELKNALCSIPLSSSLGGFMSFENINNQTNLITRSIIESFDVQFRDENYTLIDFNGSPVNFSIMIEVYSNNPPPVTLSLNELQKMMDAQQIDDSPKS